MILDSMRWPMAKVNLVIMRCTAGVHGIPGQLHKTAFI